MQDKQKESANTATARPWRIGFDDGSGVGNEREGSWIVSDEVEPDTIVSGGQDDWGCKAGIVKLADAELIVRAVNSHDALVEALQVALRLHKRGDVNCECDICPQIRAALALAEKK